MRIMRSLASSCADTLALVFLLSQTGCTLIGLGIGSTIPNNHEVAVDDITPDSDVRLSLYSGRSVSGTYAGRVGDKAIRLNDATTHVPEEMRDVASAPNAPVITRARAGSDDVVVPRNLIQMAEQRDGSYWWMGALFGATIDAAFIAIVAAVGAGMGAH
jgi:hypothetical protein